MYKTHINFEGKYVTWECTTVCNYSCSYCWPNSHDGKYRWPSPEQTDKLINYLNSFAGDDRLVLDIMGGEPTLWPDLQRFCHNLKDSSLITFSTNGSRSSRWWKNFTAPVDNLVFSFHPETADIENFSSILKQVHNRYRVTVLILYHPHYKEKCLSAFDSFSKDELEISLKMKRIDDPNISYIDSDKEILLKEYFNCKIKSEMPNIDFYVDNFKENPDEFIKLEKNKFNGWYCNLGTNYRYIKANGDIHGAACAIAPVIGNVYKEIDNDIIESIVCTENFCSCYADLVLNSKQCFMQE